MDSNNNGKPDKDDTWNTYIGGGAGTAFAIGNRDFTQSYVEDVVIEKLQVRKYYGVVIIDDMINDGCPDEVETVADGLVLRNNYFDQSGLLLLNRIDNAAIDNNLFTGSARRGTRTSIFLQAFAFDTDCAVPFLPAQGSGNSFSNNTLTQGNVANVAYQHDMEINGNDFSGDRYSLAGYPARL